MTEQADCLDQDSCSAMPGFRFDLHLLLAAMAFSLAWLAAFQVSNVPSLVLLAIYGLTYLFGCWKTRRAVLWLLPAMYSPYIWLLGNWQARPWGEFPWPWIAMYAELPGFLVCQALAPQSRFWSQVLSGLCITVIFFSAVMCARPSPKAARITALVVLLISIGNSVICFEIYKG